jgi:serine/threonine-protein kinase
MRPVAFSMVSIKGACVGQEDGYFLSDIAATYRQRAELPSYILVVDWFEQTLRSLAAIHATGRVHRSLGLDTIFVDGDHQVRITDGSAGSATSSLASSTLLSPDWEVNSRNRASCAAPEVSAGGPIDERSDLYGVGAAYYELLTNQPAGSLPQPPSRLNYPSSINNTVPQGFDPILMRLLAASPVDRYQSAMDALVDLAILRRSPNFSAAALVRSSASRGERSPGGELTGRGSPRSGVLVKSPGMARPDGVPRAAMIAAGAVLGAAVGAIVGLCMHTFLPATIIVGALVGGVVGIFANPNV